MLTLYMSSSDGVAEILMGVYRDRSQFCLLNGMLRTYYTSLSCKWLL